MRGTRSRASAAIIASLGLSAFGAGSASAAVTPGWECVPATAGQAVVSGGAGSSPSCSAGSTAVLAPTYVSSGVGGKPTVQFASVNVQILNGSGSTASKNSEGNLVLGYDESPGTQTGSHNLVLGHDQTFTGVGELVGGYGNVASGNFAAVLGSGNTAAGVLSTVAGHDNQATGNSASVVGGFGNTAASAYSSILGGCSNLAGTGSASQKPLCIDTVNHGQNFATISGGTGGQATGTDASIAGGEYNLASDFDSFIAGGCDNRTGSGSLPSGSCSDGGGNAEGHDAMIGGYQNTASGENSVTAGGEFNIAADPAAAVAGGCDNIAGSGSRNVNACDAGGEGISGGASHVATGQDGTYGVISDGANSSILGSLDVPGNTCASFSTGVSGTQAGDTLLLSFPTPPPTGLVLVPEGVDTSNDIVLSGCNHTSSTINYDNQTINYMTLR